MLQKTDTKLGDYIDSSDTIKPNHAAIARKAYRKAVNDRSSVYTLYLLAAKHKIGLLAIGNIILVLNWAFPAWPEVIKSIVR